MSLDAFSQAATSERRNLASVRIKIKRTYDPAASADGRRFLVERLWPRGMKKDALVMDAWLKEVAPSTQLRQWFGHRPERWEAFRRRYRDELSARPDAWRLILQASRKGPVTLLFSARDAEHNSASVLREYLTTRQRRLTSGRAARPPHSRARKQAAHSSNAHQDS